MDEICRHAGAHGALLLQSEADLRTSNLPYTASMSDVVRCYYKQNWHLRDERDRAIAKQQKGVNVVIDQDIISKDEISRSSYYNDLLIPRGVPWFASIAFNNASSLWGISILRTTRQGPFDDGDKKVLEEIVPRLKQVAGLSAAVGHASLLGVLNGLDFVVSPAMALDRFGRVIDANQSMQALFDENLYIVNRKLFLGDASARSEYDRFLSQMRGGSDREILSMKPLIVRRENQPSLVLRVLPLDGPARSPFLGARVVLTATVVGPPKPDEAMLKLVFDLTQAEVRVAMQLVSGLSIDRAAASLGIARVTVRNHLKAIFSKTETHRQSELVALLSGL